MPALTYEMLTGTWGVSFPDSFGASHTEGGGVAATWTSNAARNIALPYLLNRDLDPASNDNSPAFINAAA